MVQVSPSIESRPYQVEACQRLEEARANGQQRALLNIATGLGKTTIAALDFFNFTDRQNSPCRLLFVSHIRDISNQAYETFLRIRPELQATTKIKLVDDKCEAFFTTFQTLLRHLEHLPRDFFTYIIWDESHHIEAKMFKKVCEHFEPKFELGLTATPKRMDEKDITKYFGSPVYEKGLVEGIVEGWLAKVNYHIVFDDVIKKAIKESFEQRNIKQISRAFEIKPRNVVIASSIKRERHKIGLDRARTIVFCSNIQHARQMAELLDGFAYHSGLDNKVRSRLLESFKSGRINTLCVRDMFNEGVDIPDANLLIFLRSTGSDIIFKQQLGRGLRKTATKDSVTVLDFVGNIKRIKVVRQLGRDISEALRQRDGRFIAYSQKALTEESFADPVMDNFFSDNISFEFEREVVELLNVYDALKAASVAPSGYKLLVALADELNVSPETLTYYIKKHKLPPIETFISENNGFNARFVTKKTADALTAFYQQKREIPPAPKDYLPMQPVIEALKINRERFYELTKQLKTEVNEYLYRGRKIKMYSPEQFQELKGMVGEQLKAPDDVMSTVKLSALLRVRKTVIEEVCHNMQIPMKYYIFPDLANQTLGVDKKWLSQLVEATSDLSYKGGRSKK